MGTVALPSAQGDGSHSPCALAVLILAGGVCLGFFRILVHVSKARGGLCVLGSTLRGARVPRKPVCSESDSDQAVFCTLKNSFYQANLELL